MTDQLTPEDWKIILDSLKYTVLKFQDYDKYPSYEYKQQRIGEVTDVINKIKELRKIDRSK